MKRSKLRLKAGCSLLVSQRLGRCLFHVHIPLSLNVLVPLYLVSIREERVKGLGPLEAPREHLRGSQPKQRRSRGARSNLRTRLHIRANIKRKTYPLCWIALHCVSVYAPSQS
ncbi:hypothetical protein ATANTOWER_031199 [Ataeniobius toweri]|uniref:Uncharacterized protein n=1 Tax=Ataeniobius toweri TaxID=208326 RepID=A0ABU7A3R5_9TELE|nr:hypothetical protein [Ataeniobius toweri]